jgi:hypothetical protein
MPRRVLAPLLVLNGAYLVMLVLLGPVYGWVTMVLVGAFVSAANIYAIRRSRQA